LIWQFAALAERLRGRGRQHVLKVFFYLIERAIRIEQKLFSRKDVYEIQNGAF